MSMMGRVGRKQGSVAILWSGIMRMVRVCCPGSRAAAKRSVNEPAGNDNNALPRESVYRRVLHWSRPLVLTIAAALAFAALLRFHHEKFEDSMVRGFQGQQLDATRSLA